ncbi:hypothetical protein [Novosphingobium sp. 9]|uniref:hypothetical protein n=1 Tax=Novosphingobium sp. 9 TaxID=2025349 RepID=UPI0021B65CB8|nr:hypothetical protein [Novosphingobium sp. 9]
MKRLVWILALAFVGMLVVGVELDRSARMDSSLDDYVPALFQSFALENEVDGAGSQSLDGEQLDDARKLLRQRPVPAEHLRALALAEIAAGNDAVGQQAMAFAAGRGWRDPVVQATMVRAGAQAGAWDIAAQRLAALWAVVNDRQTLNDLTHLVAQTEQGRAALAQQLAGNIPARDGMMRWIAGNLTPQQAASVAMAAQAHGARFDCGQMADVARKVVVSDGDAELAQALWNGRCSRNSAPSQPGDVRFVSSAPTGDTGPFGWQLTQNSAVSADLEGSGGDVSLSVHNGGSVPAKFAERIVTLASGAHLLKLSANASGSGARGVSVAMFCLPDGVPLAGAASNGGSLFQIPAAGCRAQKLILTASPGDIEGLRISSEG